MSYIVREQQLIKEISLNGYYDKILFILLITAILCGIWVIINKNPIFAVLCLIGLILSISTYFIFIGLTYLGLAYIIVYVGAVTLNAKYTRLNFGITLCFLCWFTLKTYFYILNLIYMNNSGPGSTVAILLVPFYIHRGANLISLLYYSGGEIIKLLWFSIIRYRGVEQN